MVPKRKEIAHFSRTQRQRQQLAVDPKLLRAARLDREADAQLHLGFHFAAERLAHEAARLRDGAQ